MPILIIFVDSFPYRYLKQTKFMNSFANRYKITPSFGYSVNLHAELFAGLRPDDVGYFGEWNFAFQNGRSWRDKIIAKLSFIRALSPFWDRGIHYALNRFLNYECANIPFHSLHLFSRTGKYPLRGNWEHKTIFDEFNFTTVVPDYLPLPLGQKDKYSYAKVLEAIDHGSEKIFVSLPDLDGTAHKFGTDSSQYKERIEWIDSHTEKLAERFLNRYPQGRITILSDHGMANAKEGINFRLERRFGKPDLNKAVYFYDDLYLRIWGQDSSLKRELVDFLQGTKSGYILTPEERAFWGLSNPKLGEIIFLLKEGYAFAPNYFGLHLHCAYHGYHPKLESQKGILLYSGSAIGHEPKYLIDVYNVLRKLIQAERGGRGQDCVRQ